MVVVICMLIQYLGVFVCLFVFFNCLVGCFSMLVWTPAVLSVSKLSYMHVFCIFVFALVQRK